MDQLKTSLRKHLEGLHDHPKKGDPKKGDPKKGDPNNKSQEKKCPPNAGPPPSCAVLKNPPGLQIPPGAKMPVTSRTVNVTVRQHILGPNCNLHEKMIAVRTITYVGYVYTDVNGRKYEKQYPTWSYSEGNHTVSGPYTVIKKIDHGWKCLEEHLVGGGR